jgi:hypothetical protein
MRIAILGWGSLIWNPNGLAMTGDWQRGGLVLPIEFSRVSSDGRLTLVIDPQNGVEITTRYALSSRDSLNEAVEDLRRREGTTAKRIGFISSTNDEVPNDPVIKLIVSWASRVGMDAVVWTALTSNFEEKTGNTFSVANAMDYLKGLSGQTQQLALDYIRRAPEEVNTAVRRAVIAEFE